MPPPLQCNNGIIIIMTEEKHNFSSIVLTIFLSFCLSCLPPSLLSSSHPTFPLPPPKHLLFFFLSSTYFSLFFSSFNSLSCSPASDLGEPCYVIKSGYGRNAKATAMAEETDRAQSFFRLEDNSSTKSHRYSTSLEAQNGKS